MISDKPSELKYIKKLIRHNNAAFQGNLDYYPIILLDQETNTILEVNNAACDLYGYSYDEMLLLTIVDISAEPEKTRHAIQEQVASIPLRYHVKKDGTIFPVEINTKSFIYDDRSIMLAFVHDITDRKQADEERLFNQEIINSINTGIIVYEKDLRFGIWNPFMERMTGLSASKVFGRFAPDVFPFLRDAGVLEGLKKALNGETIDIPEFQFIIPETGKTGWASSRMTPLINTYGENIGVLETIQDITERKKFENALIASDAKQKAMIANIADVIAILDQNGIIRYISPNIETWFGFLPDEAMNTEMWDSVHPDDLVRIKKEYSYLLKKDKSMNTVEFKHKCRDGQYKDVELKAVNLIDDKDINGILVNYHDISMRKIKEEKIIYLSYHDALTGLYNRTFFEAEVKRIDVPRLYPISFIIADINGLKFANDAFGHEFGDKLLKEIANIFKVCLRKEEIVARWGGDEFVVLLPNTTNEIAAKICNRIESMSSKVKIGSVMLSVAFGYATKDDVEKDLADVMKDAENMMYQNKLLNAKSTRSESVTSLLKTMHEMNYETEEHEQRLLKIATQLGRKLGLMQQEIEELRLLAVLHDIGKLGVSKEIIMKPGRLTQDEWIEVKKHSEIGYRIAESTQGLAHISKYILSVHERWDGQGYPHGLEGNAIPKLSRIIAIFDAYDAMTGGRPYKKPMTHDETIQEISRCSGTQFDPYLVEVFASIRV